jgi:hypothetical protein
LWCGIPRAVAQKQKQREREITQHFPKHCTNPPICCRSESPSIKT